MKKRKLMIVIEENGEDDGKGFNLYLDGDKERLQQNIAEDKMSPAEFWATKLMLICISVIKETGALKKSFKMSDN